MQLSFKSILFLALGFLDISIGNAQDEFQDSLHLLQKIEGHISPKSIVSSGKGLFFAQNMMYRHTITVYDQSFNLVKTIKDKVKLKDYGYSHHPHEYKGSPVECAFSHQGSYAWVSNYNMSGGDSTEFRRPGCDGCYSSSKYDSSYVYKINTTTLEIENAVLVGSVPKYMAVSPNNNYLLVSNWSSGDLSIIDLSKEKEVKRIPIGPYPRGIAIDSKSEFAYVAVMGREKLAKISLVDFSKEYIEDVGDGPRHLCIDKSDNWLYISLNSEGKLAKLNLKDNSITKHKVGHLPRSMTLSKDDKYLYVVNYADDKVAKVDTKTMQVLEYEKTADKPIGITVDTTTSNIWVACYSGKIMVYCDSAYCGISEPLLVNKEEVDTLLVAQSISQKVELQDMRKGKFSNDEENKVVEQEERIETIEVKEDVQVEEVVSNELLKKKEEVVEEVDKGEKEVENKSYYLVAGSFSKPDNAQKFIKSIKSEFNNSFLYKNPSNGNTYVCLAKYASKSIAVSDSKKFKNQGNSNWVFSKK